MAKPTRSLAGRKVVVPDHRGIDTGTLDIILEGADLSTEEFLRLL